MARQMSRTERAARDAIAPYVRKRHMTQHEANKLIRDGLVTVADTVRQSLTAGQGGAFCWARKTAEARQAYDEARGMVRRHQARGRMLVAEMFEAVYLAVRADYMTAEAIQTEDAETPALLAALGIVKEEAAEAAARLRPGLAA
ncbi:hypothetical protein ACFV42_23065 [Streptomyces solisilvae]|uniref:hypothetical protein n=1 Tax=Streptomyces malaysiensis TaxID=92644 RepID=UPI003696433C